MVVSGLNSKSARTVMGSRAQHCVTVGHDYIRIGNKTRDVGSHVADAPKTPLDEPIFITMASPPMAGHYTAYRIMVQSDSSINDPYVSRNALPLTGVVFSSPV
ncbi:unnamed protein product [Pieris brassicae]|uniref:Uncharacterized protein n=1 Tax=Pieris brassicae TaxID=7116 RepID=A0A9P0T4M8_PIEBR|nr:unnamed protein product [Pieris brassicae]